MHDLIWSIATEKDAPRYRDGAWRQIFDEQVKKTPLSLIIADGDQMFALPIGEQEIEWEVKLSKGDAWERFCTLSQVAVLEGEEKEVSCAYRRPEAASDLSQRVRRQFNEAIDSAETDENGQVVVHGFTHLAWTTKIPADGRPALTDVETTGAK